MNLNRRLDDLINLLLTQVMDYFLIKGRLQDSGRISSKRSVSRIRAAERLISKGWLDTVTGNVHKRGVYVFVPSETTPGVTYKVVPSELYCECENNRNGGNICKHIHVCQMLSQQKPDTICEMDILLANAISQWVDGSIYDITDESQGELSITSPNSGETYYAKLSSWSCTCTSFAHRGTCVCLKVAEQVCAKAEVHQLDDNDTEQDQSSQHDSNLDEMDDDQEVSDPTPDNDDVSIPGERGDCIQQLEDMLTFMKDPSSITLKQTQETIKTAHQLCFGNFKGQTRKRRLKPLYPGRALQPTTQSKKAKLAVKGKRKSISRKQASADASNGEFAKVTNKTRQPKRPRQRAMKILLKDTMPVKLPPSQFELPQNAYDYVIAKKSLTNLPHKQGVRKAYLISVADTLSHKYGVKDDNKVLVDALGQFFAMH